MSSGLREKIRSFDPNLPLEQAHTIPNTWYFDPEIYAAECQAVFGNVWQVAARQDQVAEPGSFCTMDIAGEPILIVRDTEGTLRAFFNVCRHRAARVAYESAGKATRLRCRYHGWTYDLAGRLRGTPEFEGVRDFRREEEGLVELEVGTWGPLGWVRPKSNSIGGAPRPTLAEFLAPLPETTSRLGLEALSFVERREYVLECNWKVFVDNYLDGGYHINTIHPSLAGVLDYSQYRTEIAGYTSVQTSPLRPAAPANDSDATAKVRSGAAAYYCWIFPNLMMNIYEGLMDTNLVLPLGPHRCKVIFDFYFANTEGPAAARIIADSIAVADQVQTEDGTICEDVQRGLASRSFNTGRFSVRREKAGYHFHQLLARYLEGASTGG